MCGFREVTKTELDFIRERLRTAMDNVNELTDVDGYPARNYSASERNERLLLNIAEGKRLLGKLQSAARRQMFHFNRESYPA